MRAGAAHAPPGATVARTFARLSLAFAQILDATHLEGLDDARLAANDPVAHELLRALADDGNDGAFIRAATGGHLVLLFTESLRENVEVEQERSCVFDGERWHADGAGPDGSDGCTFMAGAHRPAEVVRRSRGERTLLLCSDVIAAVTGSRQRPAIERL
jgi:hypothetical protein